MKIEVKRKEFLESLGFVQNVAERRTNQPALSCVLLKSIGKDLWIFATDLEVFAKVKAKYEKKEDKFEIALPAHQLYELVKELESEKIEIEIQNSTGIIRSKEGKGNYKIHGLPHSQFPTLPEKNFSPTYRISSSDLYDLIEKTAFAASSDESRYVLTGILAQLENGIVRFVASDGHRLAFYEVENETTETETQFILPKNAVSDIKKIIANYQKDFEISVGESEVLLSSEDVTLWIKTIQEEYPDWRSVIPSDDDVVIRCIVKSQELKKSLKRASLFAPSKFPYVTLAPSSTKLVIKSQSDELGSMEEELDSDTTGKDEIQIVLSTKYLQEALSAIDAPLTSLKIFGAESPCVIEPVSGKGATSLIMPIRL